MPADDRFDFDVVAVGNAIVDVIAHAPDEFLVAHDLVKGAMTLVDAERSDELYDAMPPAIEASGGSAANTIAGLASFGGRGAFIGKVRDDQMGEVYRHDIHALGIHFEVPPAPSGPPTGRSLILVTPDAQRTMNTCLGIAAHLHPDDVDHTLVARSAITYCEGYLWDIESAKTAMRSAMDAARTNGGRVAFTLSDSLCVDRHRSEFVALTEKTIDILFANEHELCSLYEIDDFDEAAARVRTVVPLAFLTRSAAGSVVVMGDTSISVPAYPVDHVVDTTGAGDQYAAGALYGLTHGLDLETSGRLGSMAAAEVISHLGPRSEVALDDLAVEAGLIRPS